MSQATIIVPKPRARRRPAAGDTTARIISEAVTTYIDAVEGFLGTAAAWAAVEAVWDRATAGRRAALGRMVIAAMGRPWADQWFDAFHRFLAYVVAEAGKRNDPYAIRMRPYWSGGWYSRVEYRDHHRYLSAHESNGSISFPPPGLEWSPLSVRILEEACILALDHPGLSIRQWTGDVPGLQRSDILCAAGNLSDEDAEGIGGAELLTAIGQAMKWVDWD